MQFNRIGALLWFGAVSASASAASFVDLSTYSLVNRYALPQQSGAGLANFLAQEASGVTWNRATNSLFIVGDGSRAIVQVSLTGQLIDVMTLGLDASKPQGTAYYDLEGITAAGNNQFIVAEERLRTMSLISYTPNNATPLSYSGSQHVKLGTSVGNIGIEGLSWDPLTGGIIAVKEASPQGIFQTTLDFAAGSASNGSATTVNSTNLFNPQLAFNAGLADFADVFALSNLAGIGVADQANLLILSQESGKIIEVDRAGNVMSQLTIALLPNTGGLSVQDQQHEGLTMDDRGYLYLVSENGGGDINHPELWVYAPVPEPQSIAMLLVGLGVIGTLVRRRVRQA